MGLLEQSLQQKFKRTITTFQKGATVTVASGSPVQTMGSAYILLNAKVVAGSVPCRLRLYADETSRDVDANRAQGNYNISASVALIADIVLTNTNIINFDPPIIGNTFSGGQVYYHLSGSPAALSVNVTSYPIGINQDSNIDRVNLAVSGTLVTSGSFSTRGTVIGPKSFLILSGSATTGSRLRLYSRPIGEVSLSEISRSFITLVNSGSLLIADLVFDSASFQYPLVPIVEGYTWENENYAVGTGQIGYVLENTTNTPTNITASLYLYQTEN